MEGWYVGKDQYSSCSCFSRISAIAELVHSQNLPVDVLVLGQVPRRHFAASRSLSSLSREGVFLPLLEWASGPQQPQTLKCNNINCDFMKKKPAILPARRNLKFILLIWEEQLDWSSERRGRPLLEKGLGGRAGSGEVTLAVVKVEGIQVKNSGFPDISDISIFRVFTVGIHRGSRAVPRTRHHTCWTSQSRSQKKATRCHHRSECFIAWQHKPLQVTVHVCHWVKYMA